MAESSMLDYSKKKPTPSFSGSPYNQRPLFSGVMFGDSESRIPKGISTDRPEESPIYKSPFTKVEREEYVYKDGKLVKKSWLEEQERSKLSLGNQAGYTPPFIQRPTIKRNEEEDTFSGMYQNYKSRST